MSTLIDEFVVSRPAATARAGTEVTAIERVDGAFRVVTSRGPVFADAVVLATPAHVASRVVPDRELARELAAIRYVSTATVFFGLERSEVAHSLDGFGFIVPPGEAEILAATWVSSKWSGRAPSGTALVRAFVGGSRDPDRGARSSGAEPIALPKAELCGSRGPLGTP